MTINLSRQRGAAGFSQDYAEAHKRVDQNEKVYDQLKALNAQFQELAQRAQTAGAKLLIAFGPALQNEMTALDRDLTTNIRDFKTLARIVDDIKRGNWGAAGKEVGAWWKGTETTPAQTAKARSWTDWINPWAKNNPWGAVTGEGGAGSKAPAGSTPAVGSSGTVSGWLIAHGVPADIAHGIVGGIKAEGGQFGKWTKQADGGYTYGIEQLRGPRQAAIMAKYHGHPTPLNELEFLLSELKGGDRGGASVLGASSERAAKYAYLSGFMRPGGGLQSDLNRAGLGRGGGSEYAQGGGPTYINVDKIEITTRASDPRGVAREVRTALNSRVIIGSAQQGLN